MRDTLAGVGQRIARFARGGDDDRPPATRTRPGSAGASAGRRRPRLRASGSSATRVRVMRMIGWPIIACERLSLPRLTMTNKAGKAALFAAILPRGSVLRAEHQRRKPRRQAEPRASAHRTGAVGWRRARRGPHRRAQGARRKPRARGRHRRHQHGRGGRRPVRLGPVGRRHRARHDLGRLAGRVS